MGDREWGPAGCTGGWGPHPGLWYYGIPGQGCYYWHRGGCCEYNDQCFWVGGPIFQAFANGGYECGPAGPPTSEQKNCPSNLFPFTWYYAQRFYRGRYVAQPNGLWYQHGQFSLSCGS